MFKDHKPPPPGLQGPSGFWRRALTDTRRRFTVVESGGFSSRILATSSMRRGAWAIGFFLAIAVQDGVRSTERIGLAGE